MAVEKNKIYVSEDKYEDKCYVEYVDKHFNPQIHVVENSVDGKFMSALSVAYHLLYDSNDAGLVNGPMFQEKAKSLPEILFSQAADVFASMKEERKVLDNLV